MWIVLAGVALAVAIGFFLEHMPIPGWGDIPQLDESAPGYSLQAVADWQSHNREVWNERFFQGFFYGATYFFLWMAITVPVGSVTHQGDADLDLSTTRLHLNWVLAANSLPMLAAMLAMMLHLFLWRPATWVADHIKGLFKSVASLHPIQYGAIATMLIGAAALFIAGNVYYVVDPNLEYMGAITTPFIVAGFGALMAAAIASAKR